MRLISLVLLCILDLSAQAPPMVTPARIPTEPSKVAWWVKVEFEPVHTEIRGIPIGRLDPSWEKASELMRPGIPKPPSNDFRVEVMDENHLVFSRKGDFDHDGKLELALTGVYLDRQGKKGTFLLILKSQGPRWAKLYLESWPGKPGFQALSRNSPGVEVWTCMYCEGVSYLDWKPSKRRFVWRKRDPDDSD
jgi:hypothetical protein